MSLQSICIRTSVLFLGIVGLLLGCESPSTLPDPKLDVSSETSHYLMSDFGAVDKIDAHVHVNTKDGTFTDQAALDNMRLISINVDYPDFPAIEIQREVALYWKASQAGKFEFASTFSMTDWNNPAWAENVIADINRASQQGARAVKVWKNVGMDFRNASGDLVMIDDDQFHAVFDHLNKIDVPLIGHQGEPKNCWLPLDQMTVNNDRQYFAAHPQYHMFLHPQFPSYEDQMAARNAMLDKHDGLSFIGAHMASLEWSVDELGDFLDKYPNSVVDLAARMGQVQYQSSVDRAKVRKFFVTYQDRILYASDLTSMPNDDSDQFRTSIHNKWLNDWRYLNTNEEFSVPEVNSPVVGLALPKSVVDKIYSKNAIRVFKLAQD